MSEWFRWWLVVQLAGFVLLPLCISLFRRLPDRGYTLSKPFGLLFLGYLFWLLNSFHIVPNSAGGIVFSLLLLAAISGAFLYVRRDEMRDWARGSWQYILAVEVVLLVVFAVAAWLRSIVGTTTLTEQPMDLMFVNAATRASHFPPADPWLSGHTVAYYYFGYLLVAMTGRLAGVPPEIAYNLGFAMTATLALIGAAGIAYNLVRMHETAAADAPNARSHPPRTRNAHDGGPREPRPRLTSLLIQQRTRRMAPPPEDASIERATAILRAAAVPPSSAPPPAEAAIQAAPAAAAEVRARPAPDTAILATAPAAAEQALSWRAPVFGLAAGLMLVALGNLVWLFQFASAYPELWRRLAIPGIGSRRFYDWLDVSGLTADVHRNSWYPSDYFGLFGASRIYAISATDRVITEFPMFSFVLGDLHPHVMALPFVLLAVGLALALYRSREPLDIVFWIQRPLALVAAAVVLGGLAFLNTWDIATLALVVVAGAGLSNFLRVGRLTLDLFVQVASFALPLIALAIVLYLPFYLSFSSQADGVGAVVTNRAVTVPGTRPVSAVLFWGPLLVMTLPLVFSRLAAARRRITAPLVALSLAPAALIVIGWVLVFSWEKARDSAKLNGAAGIWTQIGDRASAWFTDAFFAAMLAAALLALWLEITSDERAQERESVVFTLGLITTAMLLVLGTEFFYVGDVFNSRMNTVFKLYYQAWLLLAVAGGFCLYYLVSRWRFTFPKATVYRWAWGIGAVLVLGAGALYPIGATMNRLRPYDRQGNLLERGGNLDALSFMSPDERAGVAFLTNVAQGQDLVIAEAVGGDYWVNGQYARVSAASGVPAVLGWGGHEDQWHGSSAIRAGRFDDINALYKTTDAAEAEKIVKKYGIDYIYVGPLERTTYGDAGLAKFQSMPVVFQQGAVTIYRASAGITTGEVQGNR
jgi:YYY domain-containing protein